MYIDQGGMCIYSKIVLRIWQLAMKRLCEIIIFPFGKIKMYQILVTVVKFKNKTHYQYTSQN